MEHKNEPAHEHFQMVKLPDGHIINVKSKRTYFPHNEGLSDLISAPANEQQKME